MGHLRKTQELETAAPSVLQSRELASLVQLYVDQFSWRAGSYEGLILTKLIDVNLETSTTFSFDLSSEDVEQLRMNIETVKRDLAYRVPQIPIAKPPTKH